MAVERAPVGRTLGVAAVPSRSEPSAELLGDWVARIALGDAAAFEALFHAFYDRLCDFAESYVRSSHAAEEIVDDVFLALWAGRDRLRPLRSVANYLYVAVRNRALSYLRRGSMERRFAEHEEIAQRDAFADRRNDIEDSIRSSELFALAERAIDELPERMRETYLLFYRHGRSYAEIAEIMGVSVRTVENQLARSLQRLWRALHGQLE